MNGYGGHTYQWINAAARGLGEVPLPQRPGHQEPHRRGGHGRRRGPRLTAATSSTPSHGGEFELDVSIQVMPYEDAETTASTLRPHQGLAAQRLPADPVGTMTLNRNPENYFAEIEQAAF